MGSTLRELPSSSSPDLVLAESTTSELQHVWALHHPMWGAALKLDDYLNRETFLMTVPLAKDGGVTHWILTDKTGEPDSRPIYASCESLRKRALASRAGPDGQVEVQDGIAHGIASVFTNPAYRGKGYASRMMAELGPKLRAWSVGRTAPSDGGAAAGAAVAPRSLFSVLYSDIGKAFYARHGWAPFASTHLRFPPAADGAAAPASKATPLGYHDLAVLCELDEQALRQTMRRRAGQLGGSGSGGKQACAALLPDLDQLRWHLRREDFMTARLFGGRTPAVRGALAGTPGRRVWAVWARGYYGGAGARAGNTLHILRCTVEGAGAGAGAAEMAEEEEEEDAARVAAALRDVIAVAQLEAREWLVADVQMWNPSPLLQAAAARSGLAYERVERETEAIASLMWYGDEPTAAVEWVANEKFAWC